MAFQPVASRLLYTPNFMFYASMYSMRTALKLGGFLLCMLLFSCHRVDPRDVAHGDKFPANFPGLYAYRNQRGQIESLSVNSDGSFRQEFYNDEAGFLSKGKPLIVHSGQMQCRSGKIEGELLYFGIFPHGADQPDLVAYYNLFWVPHFDGRPAIMLDEDSFYWLVKLSSREEVGSVRFSYR